MTTPPPDGPEALIAEARHWASWLSDVRIVPVPGGVYAAHVRVDAMRLQDCEGAVKRLADALESLAQKEETDFLTIRVAHDMIARLKDENAALRKSAAAWHRYIADRKAAGL